MPTVASGKEYHRVTSYDRFQMKGHGLDWANQPNPYKAYEGIHQIPLPDVMDLPKMSPWDLNNGNVPDKPKERLDLQAVARTLLLGYGITAKARQPGYDFFYRSAASAGALYPIEIYMVAFGVDGLEPGMYHYDIRNRALTLLRNGLFRTLCGKAITASSLGDTAACFFITGIFFRTAWKYRNRAMRYVLLDAGHVLENLCLSLKAEGMDCSIHYDFDDQQLNRFLGVDEKRETCLACMPVYGKSSTASQELLKIDSMSENIRAASRISSNEVFYEEIESVCRAGRKVQDQTAEVRDMNSQLGLEPHSWMPMIPAEPVENEFNFSEAVFHRRSKRNYIDINLSSVRLWRLLDLVCGAAGQGPPLFRTYGTCLATGFFAENIDGLDSGLYLINVADKRIGRVRQGRFLRKSATACLDQQWLRNASLHFLFMTNLDELDKTWGPRGYRYAMMLAGQMGQAVYLGAAALGLGACGIGALYDNEAKELIGLNEDSVLLYLVAAGPVKRF